MTYRPILPRPREDPSTSRNLQSKIPYLSLRCPIPSCPLLFPSFDILSLHLKSEHDATTEAGRSLDLQAPSSLQSARPSDLDQGMKSRMHVLRPGASEGGPDNVTDRTTLHTEPISLTIPPKASSPSIRTNDATQPSAETKNVQYKQCPDCMKRKKRCRVHATGKTTKRNPPGRSCAQCKKDKKRCGGIPCERCKHLRKECASDDNNRLIRSKVIKTIPHIRE